MKKKISHSQKMARLRRKCDALLQEIYVPRNPKCLLCFNPTYTMHHFIEKACSSYLRYDEKNLIPLCMSHHYQIHFSKTAGGLKARIHAIMGMTWTKYIARNSQKTIKVNLGYYQNQYQKLMTELSTD